MASLFDRLLKRQPKQEFATPRRSKEIGGTGTDNIQGIIESDYNPKLSGKSAIDVYDEMRRSDGTVHAAVQAVTLPIRRAHWDVFPASEESEDQQIAEFVKAALFDIPTISWDDFIRQALLMVPFGVMPFEKVYDVQNVDGVERIVWTKFAPRLPSSIEAWQTDDGKEGIRQFLPNGGYANIPMEKLLVFVNNMEGDNWWGISALRPAYKHWYIKNTLYKIDAIAFERQGLGVPKAKMKDTAGDAEREKAAKVLKNMYAHEKAYLIEDAESFEVEFMDMGAKNTRDPKDMIAHHNREIVKGVLAQFLELGANEGSGSRALSEDHSELFMLSLEAIANNIADTINKHAIRQLVDFNFDNAGRYPFLDFSDIQKTDVDRLATAYKTFTESNALQATDADEQHIRNLMGLPERDEDDQARTEPEDEEPDEQAFSRSKKKVFRREGPNRTEAERIYQEAIDGHESTIQSRYEAEWLPELEKTEQGIRDMILAKLERAKTETVGGVEVYATDGNLELLEEIEREVNRRMKALNETLLSDSTGVSIVNESMAAGVRADEEMQNKRQTFARRSAAQLLQDIGLRRTAKHFFLMYKSNIDAFVRNEGRRIKERLRDNIFQNASVQTVKKQIKNLKLNRNTYKLSAITHPRAAFRHAVDKRAKERGVTSYKMLVPTQVKPTLKTAGKTAALLYLIKTWQEWDEEGNVANNASVTGGMGLHHNSQDYYYPVDMENIEQEREISKAQRRAWLAALGVTAAELQQAQEQEDKETVELEVE